MNFVLIISFIFMIRARRQKEQSSNQTARERMDNDEATQSTDDALPSSTTTTTTTTTRPINFTFHPIGITSSIFRLCVGTPRQGLIAPNTRARIDISTHCIAAESIIDLSLYSHIWLIFVFHLNTHPTKNHTHNTPAKIAPPALGGRKVGVFATRTPHRPNPIGMTLCKLDKITQHNTFFTLHISGVDLVDGTPILDIKPFVPHYDTTAWGVPSTSSVVDEEVNMMNVQVPPWVMDGLEKRKPVHFTSEARNQLIHITSQPHLYPLEFYGVESTRDASQEETFVSLQGCIEQVLGVDVRSPYHTHKVRKGQFHAEKTTRVRESLQATASSSSSPLEEPLQEESGEKDKEMCTQQLDRLLIRYYVEYRNPKPSTMTTEDDKRSINTDGSGADDTVIVYGIEYMPSVKR